VALTKDVRLLLDESATVSARIPNLLPLQDSIWASAAADGVVPAAAVFAAAIVGSMGALPAVFPDGQTPEKDGSWYLMGPIRQHSALGAGSSFAAGDGGVQVGETAGVLGGAGDSVFCSGCGTW